MFRQQRILLLCTTLCATVAVQAMDDPMRPPEAADAGKPQQAKAQRSEPSYRLSAIRIAHDHRSATINDKHVAIGDRIGEARVAAINANGVTLNLNGKTVTIGLLPLSIKKPVEAKLP